MEDIALIAPAGLEWGEGARGGGFEQAISCSTPPFGVHCPLVSDRGPPFVACRQSDRGAAAELVLCGGLELDLLGVPVFL
jgi:hypothetical protein